MEKGVLLYEGKAKRIYATNDDEQLWIEYKDDATAFNGEKKETLEGKSRLNNEITSLIFSYLHEHGVESHFIKRLSETEQLVKRVEIIPLEVVVRNVIAGNLAKRLGKEEGTVLPSPIVEFYYKDDALGDPLVTEDHIGVLEIASPSDLVELREKALEVSKHLITLFNKMNVRLIDFKLEFGRTENGDILLADEISPDTCRLWDKETNRRLDKDIFRRDLGSLQEGYEEILSRLGGASCTK